MQSNQLCAVHDTICAVHDEKLCSTKVTKINMSVKATQKIYKKIRMWANAQRDGHPAEYRWRPLLNATKFG